MFGSAGPESSSGSSGTDEKKKKKTSEIAPSQPASSTLSLLNGIVIDSLDLTLPGSFLGWIPLETLGIGMAMLVSTVLVWPTAWAKAQR